MSNAPLELGTWNLVLPSINTMTYEDGVCEVRSRREEEAVQWHRRRRTTKRSPATPIRPKGWGGTGPSLCCSSSPMSGHRLVVAPRSGLRRAPNIRRRTYGREYLGWNLDNSGFLNFSRFQALRANADFSYRAIDDGTNPLQVGIPPTLRHVMRVRDSISELRAFSTDLANSCHCFVTRIRGL